MVKWLQCIINNLGKLKAYFSKLRTKIVIWRKHKYLDVPNSFKCGNLMKNGKKERFYLFEIFCLQNSVNH